MGLWGEDDEGGKRRGPGTERRRTGRKERRKKREKEMKMHSWQVSS